MRLTRTSNDRRFGDSGVGADDAAERFDGRSPPAQLRTASQAGIGRRFGSSFATALRWLRTISSDTTRVPSVRHLDWSLGFAALGISGCGDYEVACKAELATLDLSSDTDPIWSGTDTTWQDLVAALGGTWAGNYAYNCDVLDCGSATEPGQWQGSWTPDAFEPMEISGPRDSNVTEICPVYLQASGVVTTTTEDTAFSADGAGEILLEVYPADEVFEIQLDTGVAAAPGSPLAGVDGELFLLVDSRASGPAASTCTNDGSALVATLDGSGDFLVSGEFHSAGCGE